MGLLDQARRELRGKSRVARNISLLSYTSRGGGQAAPTAGKGGAAGSKLQKAVQHLLQLDAKKHRGKQNLN